MQAALGLASAIDRITGFIGRSVSWLILVAVLISAGNAVVRKVLNTSSNAWLEMQWYLFGAVFLLSAAYTLAENEHIRIDIVYGRWSKRTRDRIDLFGHVFFLMPFVLLMAWLCWDYFILSYRIGEQSTNAGGLTVWPAKLLLVVGFGLLAIQGVSEIIKKIAVMQGLIEDPHAAKSSHAIPEELARLAQVPPVMDDDMRTGGAPREPGAIRPEQTTRPDDRRP